MSYALYTGNPLSENDVLCGYRGMAGLNGLGATYYAVNSPRVALLGPDGPFVDPMAGDFAIGNSWNDVGMYEPNLDIVRAQVVAGTMTTGMDLFPSGTIKPPGYIPKYVKGANGQPVLNSAGASTSVPAVTTTTGSTASTGTGTGTTASGAGATNTGGGAIVSSGFQMPSGIADILGFKVMGIPAWMIAAGVLLLKR